MERMIRGRCVATRAAFLIAALLVGAACSMSSPSPSTPSPRPTVTTSLPTASPSASPEPSGTAGDSSAAPVYPLVNSCNPASIPSAVAVTGASARAGSVALHVPILTYHRIVPVAEAGDSLPSLVVPPATFSAQLDGLAAAGWHTITMATLANDLRDGVKPPPKTFVITIDDGWADGYTYALPILAKHGYVATYFVIAGRIDRPHFLSSAQLQALVAAGDEIGDHTMTHVDLTVVSASILLYQVDAAAARIAQVTGRWPESFAYPHGRENAQAAAAVGACQELQIAVVEGSVTTHKPVASHAPLPTETPVATDTWADRFAIPRVGVSPDTTPAELRAELNRYLPAG